MNRIVVLLARISALTGGAILLALVAVTCVSVLARAGLTVSTMADLPAWFSRLRPIRGDYELIELGSAIAICAFLPWCHLAAAHARVDLLGGRFARGLDRFWDAAIAACMAFLAWRMWDGMLTKRLNAETTFLLHIPVWWAFAACVAGLAAAALTGLWMAARGRAA
ncbi:MAG: TRAP transporter small permease subunit [Paracoccus sp. (in: a-proteobacteria)]|uniref:TRAP transporter small permease n=1 Tax=Paracoccus sp. TaxID=267 RepID=UPI0026DF88C8|nr:TRAP transporter small permease subunit [Paracoccus sp. (in: a-proteobacteria)]MDO5630406.1 TRAP transporter small permease subunit [Paracoccus sp. (in: a-proteobacteria)]